MKNTYLPIRIVIADDHELFRLGLKAHLSKFSGGDIEVIGDAENGIMLLDVVNNCTPDVILTDIKMPLLDGLNATRKLIASDPSCRIIVLSLFDDEDFIYDALAAGAKGFLPKHASITELSNAIFTVSSGGTHFEKYTFLGFQKLMKKQREKPTEYGKMIFTDKELQFLQFLCQDFALKEIADKMNLSVRSVENYCKILKEKTGSRNMVGIAIYAIKNGLLTNLN